MTIAIKKKKKLKNPARSKYLTYEQQKQRIAEIAKSHDEYERMILKLAQELGV